MALALLVLAALCSPAVEAREVISDLMAPEADAGRARKIKAETFWTPLLRAAEGTNLSAHLTLYDDAAEVIAELPAGEVRDAVSESLRRLQAADQLVLEQAAGSWQVAKEGLQSPEAEEFFSFLHGGQSFMRDLVRRFVDGGDYKERVRADVGKRQGEVLPALRGAASSAGDVLTNTRLASKRAFDALKYNIYVSRTPKTPEEAQDVAHRLVDAAGETRKHFMSLVTAAVNGIASDAEGQTEAAGATVTRSELGLGTMPMGAPPSIMAEPGAAGGKGAALVISAGSSTAEIGLQLVL